MRRRFARLLFRLPLHRLSPGPRFILLGLAGIYPVAGGDGSGEPPAGDPPAGGPPAGDPPAGDPAAGDKRFTQADLDRVVQERLARDRRDRPSDDELAQLREKAGKFDEHEQANRSELERAQQALAEAEQKATEAQSTAHRTLRNAAIVAEAAKQGALDPGDVVALLSNSNFKVAAGDQEHEVTVGDDGQVTGAEQAVTALLEQKKHLVGERTPDPGPGDGGARTASDGSLTAEQLRAMTPQQVAALDQKDIDAALASGS